MDRNNPFFDQVDSREPNPYNISIVGWEEDHCSVIVSMRGSFYARLGEIHCSFGITDDIESLTWENHSGYLPCLVTTFRRGEVRVEVSHFCNKVTIDGNDYSLLYSRVKKTNQGTKPVLLPAEPSTDLTRISPAPSSIPPGGTEAEDFVTPVDRFGRDIPWPDRDALIAAGTWDESFEQMRDYWEDRLSCYVRFEKLPDQRLADAFRAGTIYQLIVMDGLKMDVGVNAYREEFSHDTIGMIAAMIETGDLDLARKVLDVNRSRLVAPLDYPDGDYKYSWPWTLYLLKTGNTEFVRSNFTVIRAIMRASASQMTGPGGIMRLSCALDNPGHWLVDNWAFLTGLAAYRVLSRRLGEADEEEWAVETYDKLLDACNKTLTEVSEREGISYLPAFMLRGYPEFPNKDNTSAGWATALHMGRWPWEGYLLGARQEGVMLDHIDSTYDYGFDISRNSLPPHAFGGFNGYCSSYNAGFGFAGLRGDRYRSEGIRAYQFMIENAMSGPYSWWESIQEPDPDCKWTPGQHPVKGSGSCPHMWGDSFSRMILLNSLISEFADGRVIIGRGVPVEWLEPANEIIISNVPLQDRRRFGYRLTSHSNFIDIAFSGDQPAGEIIVDLPGLPPSQMAADGVETLAGAWPISVPRTTRHIRMTRGGVV